MDIMAAAKASIPRTTAIRPHSAQPHLLRFHNLQLTSRTKVATIKLAAVTTNGVYCTHPTKMNNTPVTAQKLPSKDSL